MNWTCHGDQNAGQGLKSLTLLATPSGK